jgi:hypothetical protein
MFCVPRGDFVASIKYEYVFSWFIKKPKRYEEFNFVGCKNLDALIAMAAGAPKRSKYKAYTKAEADKLGIKPTIICMGKAGD